MIEPDKIYGQISSICKKANLLSSTIRLLDFDQNVYLPKTGLAFRTEQNKLLSELQHKQKTSPRYAQLLSKLIDLDSGTIKAASLSEEKKACLRELRRDYLQEKKLPSSFIKNFTEATTQSLTAWTEAKKANSFKQFLPHLKKVISLNQKKAEYLGYQGTPYDALLDLYEPETPSAKIDQIFKPLKDELKALVKKIKVKHTQVDPQTLKGHFPSLSQEKLSHTIVEAMGLPKDSYQLAQSAHPFCSSFHPTDIRMTTHYHTDDFQKAFYATIHETGHGLYEAGLPQATVGLPLSEPASYGVHESQSRLWETFIGQSRPFLHHFYPKIQEAFSPNFDNLPFEQFLKAVNTVEPTLIRIFADEVTYNLHIILRYEIEKGFMDGSINPKDLPEIWNAKMQDYLGVTPPDFASGCLQDVHWSLGYIGYFPSYTLGNLYAGALYKKITHTFPKWEERIASGDLSFILSFLREHIHKHGRFYPPLKLIEKATGEPFTPKPYIDYLFAKYI